MSQLNPPTTEPIEFDGMLIRSDLTLLRGISIVALMILAISVATTSIEVTVALLSAAVFLVCQHVASGLECRESVRVAVHSNGLELKRFEKGSLLGPWHYFESATLLSRNSFILTSQQENWRLYLSNTFRPSIGAFLHHKAATRTIFYFPIEIDIDADQDHVNHICTVVGDYISSAEDPAVARRRRLLSLAKCSIPEPRHVCRHCGHEFHEFGNDDRCPRCGLPEEA